MPGADDVGDPAHAAHGEAMIAPAPSATANAPTRPTYRHHSPQGPSAAVRQEVPQRIRSIMAAEVTPPSAVDY